MSKKSNVSWCVVDYTQQPPLMRCTHCGETTPLALPMDLRMVVKKLDGFTLMHSLCKPKM